MNEKQVLAGLQAALPGLAALVTPFLGADVGRWVRFGAKAAARGVSVARKVLEAGGTPEEALAKLDGIDDLELDDVDEAVDRMLTGLPTRS